MPFVIEGVFVSWLFFFSLGLPFSPSLYPLAPNALFKCWPSRTKHATQTPPMRGLAPPFLKRTQGCGKRADRDLGHKTGPGGSIRDNKGERSAGVRGGKATREKGGSPARPPPSFQTKTNMYFTSSQSLAPRSLASLPV